MTVDKELAKKFQECETKKEREEFRKDFAKTKMEEAKQTKTEIKEWQKISKDKGIYRPLPMIVVKEGGSKDPENVAASIRYAQKCMAMGGDWISFNCMTERLEFLHIRREHTDIFKRAWQMCKQEEEQMIAKMQRFEDSQEVGVSCAQRTESQENTAAVAKRIAAPKTKPTPAPKNKPDKKENEGQQPDENTLDNLSAFFNSDF